MTMYLLTIQIQQGSTIYTSNEVTEVSPEVWLARKLRENDDKAQLVILNAIKIEDCNSIAFRLIGEQNIEIVQRNAR